MAAHQRPPFHDAIYQYEPGNKPDKSDLLEQLQELIDDGEDINEKQLSSGRTPLYFACGHIGKCGDKTVAFLIENGANPMIADNVSNMLPVQRYLMEKRIDVTNAKELCQTLDLFGMRAHCEALFLAGDSNKILDYLNLSHLKVENVTMDSLDDFLAAVAEKSRNISGIAETMSSHTEYFVQLFDPDVPKTETETNFLTALSAIIPSDTFRQDYITGNFNSSGEMSGIEYGITLELEKTLVHNVKLLQFFMDNQQTLEAMVPPQAAAQL